MRYREFKVAAGDTRCSVKNDGTECGNPGVHHILVNDTGKNIITCNEHMGIIVFTFGCMDRHLIGPECNMPGTAWKFKQKESSSCALWAEDDSFLSRFLTRVKELVK